MVTEAKAPPILTTDIDYEIWKKEIEIWRILFTSVDKKKQAPAIFLSLAGQAREAIVSLDINRLFCDHGVENLREELEHMNLMNNLRNFVDRNQ